jgi:hypothetical protein
MCSGAKPLALSAGVVPGTAWGSVLGVSKGMALFLAY